LNSTILTFHSTLRRTARTLAATNLPASYLATTTAMLATAWLLAFLAEQGQRLELAALLTLAAIVAVRRPRRQPCLRVLYHGENLTVDGTNIKPHMEVPTDGGPFGYDNFGGPTAAALFSTAVAHGAIKVPAQLRVQCFANETHGNDVILLATTTDGRARVSTGWLDSASIGVRDTDETRDRENVASALRFMVAQLNAALHPDN